MQTKMSTLKKMFRKRSASNGDSTYTSDFTGEARRCPKIFVISDQSHYFIELLSYII